MIYETEGWVVLKFDDLKNGVFYKIFASWRLNERWRLSSGAHDISELEDCGDHWKWAQSSGSCYILPKDGEDGFTFYTGHQLDLIMSYSNNIDGVNVERIALSEVFRIFNNESG